MQYREPKVPSGLKQVKKNDIKLDHHFLKVSNDEENNDPVFLVVLLKS